MGNVKGKVTKSINSKIIQVWEVETRSDVKAKVKGQNKDQVHIDTPV